MSRLLAALFSTTFASPSSVPQPSPNSGAQTWLCAGPGAGSQAWTFLPYGSAGFIHLSLPNAGVLGVPEASNATGVQLGVEPLRPGGAPSQLWEPVAAGGALLLLRSALNGRCAAASDPIDGAHVYLQPCNASDALQQWKRAGNSTLTQLNTCLDVGGRLNCSSPTLRDLPYCNASAPAAARAADLAARLGIYDLRLLLGGWYFSAGAPRLGLPRISFAEALHGLGAGCGPRFENASYATSGCPSSFPHATLLGATFNRSLWHAIGGAISTEARATKGGLLLYTPDINLSRDNRWGRAQEVPGECPLLTSEYAAAFVSGLQAAAPGGPLRAAATCKHFAAYDVEEFGNITRHTFDALVSRKDLAEYFFPPFQACVQRGGAAAVMSSINSVNGVPGAANTNFTVKLLHGTWGSTAFVTSDCGTVADIQRTHHYAATPEAAVADALRGGTDWNCGNFEAPGVSGSGYFAAYLPAAVGGGFVGLDEVRGAAARFLTAVFALGLVDGEAHNPFASWGPERVDTPAHRQLALEAAVQGVVLLRNEGGALPLALGSLHSLAVLGPHFNMSSAMLANYAGSNTLVQANTPLLRLRARADAVGVPLVFAPGVPSPHSNDTSGVSAAAAVAASASAAVLFLGLDQTLEREGLDRVDLALPDAQAALLAAVTTATKASGTTLIVVLVGGGSIAEDAQGAAALVAAFYPGELGGEALAALLLGEARFSGRLPVTMYARDWAARRLPTDMALAPHGTVPGATYFYAEPRDVLFPFGAGLTSEPFAARLVGAANLSVDAGAWVSGAVGPPSWRVAVANAGAPGGPPADVALLGFFVPAGKEGPRAKLFDFARASGGAPSGLLPGEEAELVLTLPARVAAGVDAEGARTLAPGVYGVRLGGDALGGGGNTGAPLLGWVTVTGEAAAIDALPF